MRYLIFASLIWALSFGLIKTYLSGQLDANLVAFIRLALSLLLFAPLIKLSQVRWRTAVNLVLIGALQFGVMYIAYIKSYSYLQAHVVALLTIFTPLYVTLVNALFAKKLRWVFLGTALLAVLGAAVVNYGQLGKTTFWSGVLLLQFANLCFAFGQVAYKKVLSGYPDIKDHTVFGWLYLGAALITGCATVIQVDLTQVKISTPQILALLHLGLVASGIGLFLWNYGARRVNSGALAIMNNLKIPLAVAVSLLLFSDQSLAAGQLLRLLLGGGIVLLALFVNEWYWRRLGSST